MAEASRPTILRVHGNPDALNSASFAKEVPDGVFRSMEAEVSTEDRITLTWRTTCRSTNRWFVASELNTDLSVIEPEAV